ncbi:MAG TPA: winged helix-turn-helix transcriptional regulator [Tepidimicrobium sp.]|nr:winged helix-turn-helix transcriptional regulator [Tepidimicrobium sp.]
MEKLINFFKLLSDETRLRILVLLYHDDFCVCQLAGIMRISQPNVSKHLAGLRDMSLVRDEKREQYTFYSLNIEEKMFQDIFEKIVANLDKYPVLKSDIKESEDAEKYIELANINK